MSRDARQMPPLRPATVAIHDYRQMPRQPAKVQLFQQKCFFGGYRAKRMRGRDVESF
jgi:hypothetical protein